MSIRILLVTGSYAPMKCGVGDYTRSLVAALSQRPDVRLAVLTDIRAASGKQPAYIDFFPIIDGDNKETSLSAAADLFKKWRPDIIHIQWPTMGYATWGNLVSRLPLRAWAQHIPVVATWHEPYKFRLWGWLDLLTKRGLIFVRHNYLELMPAWFPWAMKLKPFCFIRNASTIPAKRLNAEQRQEVRKKLGAKDRRIVVFFGFIYPNKKVEQIFEIANPARDHIVLVGELGNEMPYHRMIRTLTENEKWKGKVSIAGFLSADEVGDILASADAVILPFELGGGSWNTSIHAVRSQGVFLLTTSTKARGYVAEENTYYVEPGDIDDMKRALAGHIGQRIDASSVVVDIWPQIAQEHVAFYKRCLGKG